MSVPKGIIEFADLALCSPYRKKLLGVRIIIFLSVTLPILLTVFYNLPIEVQFVVFTYCATQWADLFDLQHGIYTVLLTTPSLVR